jgi:glutamate/tyrosine decarboxylase-like PLP-dependent enzyme
MHSINAESEKLREAILDYARGRMSYDVVPLDAPATLEFLQTHAPNTVNEAGMGGDAALKVFTDVLATACLSTDHPGYVSFIPTAPTSAATAFDLVVSASSIYGGSWMEGAGAVYAENEVLAWLAREVGLPSTSGGVFVQGGTLGNLSALVAARHTASAALAKAGKSRPARWKFVCSSEAHSSLKAAASVMDVDIVAAKVGEDGRLTGAAVEEAIATAGEGLFAVVATAGTTNFGIVDRLREVGEVAKANGLWYHVDGAYGLAAILAPETRALFDGSELADSFIVDPHKWLYAPFDACALVYREPALAKAAHTQHGEYLDTLTDSGEWNPSDYAYNLTRRVRGLPLWFSLATYGVGAYREAIAENIRVTHEIAEVIRNTPKLRLVREPELSVVVFEHEDWVLADYKAWSQRLLQSGLGLVVPSSHQGRPNTRFAIINPATTTELLVKILATMEQK